MTIVAWIILGGVAGWIASLLMNTDASQGIMMNIIVGIIGAFVGGMLFNVLGGVGVTGFDVYSLIVAVIGSVVLIGLVKALNLS